MTDLDWEAARRREIVQKRGGVTRHIERDGRDVMESPHEELRKFVNEARRYAEGVNAWRAERGLPPVYDT